MLRWLRIIYLAVVVLNNKACNKWRHMANENIMALKVRCAAKKMEMGQFWREMRGEGMSDSESESMTNYFSSGPSRIRV